MAIYCIDSNSLINAHYIYYKPSVFPGLWKKIEESIDNGSLVSSDLVFEEITHLDNDLNIWAKQNKNMFIKPDEVVIQETTSIISRFPNLIDAQAEREQADPYLIALAKSLGAIVVTEEVWSNGRPKIPNVCQSIGISCMNFSKMLSDIGWQFN